MFQRNALSSPPPETAISGFVGQMATEKTESSTSKQYSNDDAQTCVFKESLDAVINKLLHLIVSCLVRSVSQRLHRLCCTSSPPSSSPSSSAAKVRWRLRNHLPGGGLPSNKTSCYRCESLYASMSVRTSPTSSSSTNASSSSKSFSNSSFFGSTGSCGV